MDDVELDIELLCDPSEKAAREAANGVSQLEYIEFLIIEQGVQELRESHVFELQRLAVKGIYPCAGHYRTWTKRVGISSGSHIIPEPALVPTLVLDAIEFVNSKSLGGNAVHRAAYALWRFNWIHPFAGGNGRTSRAIAYLVLCAGFKAMLPGARTFPTAIYERRDDYIIALRATDKSEAEGELQLDPMIELVARALLEQLKSAVETASSRR